MKVFQKRRTDDKPNYSTDWYILSAVAGLLLIGLAYLYSAIIGKTGSQELISRVMDQSPQALNQEFSYQLILGVIGGIILCFIVSMISYKVLLRYSNWLYWALLASLLIIAIPVTFVSLTSDNGLQDLSQSTGGFLHYANNSIRWIKIGFTIQPAEVAKIVLLLYLAAQFGNPSTNGLKKITQPFVLIAICLLAILVQPDLGSVIIIASILISALWVAGVKMRYFASVITIGAVLTLLLISFVSFRNDRLVAWVYQNFCRDVSLTNPEPKAERKGICTLYDFDPSVQNTLYQTEQIRQAMARGGLLGVGYNAGTLKTLIPEVRTDGIIGVIGEESGFVMVGFILFLYGIIILRGLQIAEKTNDISAKMIATGIVVWIGIQALWNITGMTGLIPMKGLTLPFISEGNSSLLTTLVAIGILFNIAKTAPKNTEEAIPYNRSARPINKKVIYR